MADVKRRAGWLPEQADLEAWLEGHRQRARDGASDELHPVLVEFSRLLDSDPILRLHVNEMIAQVPAGKAYRDRHVTDLPELLQLINAVLTVAPEFGNQSVTLPLGAILDWTMGTSAGFAAYRDPRLNEMIRKILTVWCGFLSGPDSLYVLNDSETGWTSAAARAAIGIEDFQYDPTDPHWGFTSWNDFFSRRLREGARPIAAPDDDTVIVAACESTPYAIATKVSLQDEFWVKNQPYSLADLLYQDPAAPEFVGGTVFQAFLSATNYHRWHSPVAGTVVRAFVAPGTYYSEADSTGADAVEPMDSQGYLAHVATRAIILIDADNPAIGLVGFVAVGMSEVSSCLIDSRIAPGNHVDKGDELGYFQFGGSTHCLVFRPGAVADFTLTALPRTERDPELLRVRSRLATAGVRPDSAPAGGTHHSRFDKKEN